MESEELFALRVRPTLSRIEIEKEKKKLSKLPVRTWKRSRTKEPSSSRYKSHATHETADEKFQKKDAVLETASPNDQARGAENDEICEKIVGEDATKDCNDIKRKYGAGLSSTAGKSGPVNLKELKGGPPGVLNTKGTYEHRKKTTNSEYARLY